MAINWNKDYTTYNNGQFQTRQLNLIQRGLRVIGFYSNTRLARVAQLAIESFYNSETQYNAQHLDLAKKAIRLQKIDGKFQIVSTAQNVSYTGQFLENGSTSFQVRLVNENRSAIINIENFQNDRLSINSLYEENYPKTTEFLDNENDPLVKASYSFINQVLINSPRIMAVSLQGNRVGSVDIARAQGYKDDEIGRGLTLTKSKACSRSTENIHDVSMRAFFPRNT